ncbi:prolipoprotein diacylglyceryl transferase [Streptomyces blattellae]|uniref:hypothetical protein n=1 Tax=Streptomyces blattellae TaxID=2569855 RepID=UPI0012B859AE|nr:hypothetical protein [Streptomyces blattellae]
MPRGRHRHSPPLHRLLPPSAIAGVSVVCALGPWVFSEATVLRGLAAAAAATAVIGAVVLRRWDTQAGKQVADLTRARASDEWRYEERVAELETDLEESRALRVKLEQRLRAKRTELAGLRNEHAALLRRYATAETERASALEGRRLLEIETTTPVRALPPVPSQANAPEEETEAVAASGESTESAAGSATESVAESVKAVEAAQAGQAGQAEQPAQDEQAGQDEQDEQAGQVEPVAPAVFSPEGSKLFLRAKVALAKLDADSAPKGDAEAAPKGDADGASKGDAESASKDGDDSASKGSPDDDGSPKGGAPVAQEPVKAGAGDAAQEDEAQGKPEAVDGHERAAATSTGKAAQSAQQPSGHFTVPTAVAVVPASPVRRPAVEGGFDFFGTKTESASAALEAVQNEDLADVVGQEALALHKAETEAEFKPADAESRGVGQVIDLTAHDETEHIDLQGLRSAAS